MTDKFVGIYTKESIAIDVKTAMIATGWSAVCVKCPRIQTAQADIPPTSIEIKIDGVCSYSSDVGTDPCYVVYATK